MRRCFGYICQHHLCVILVSIFFYVITQPSFGRDFVIDENIINKWKDYKDFSRSIQGKWQRTMVEEPGGTSHWLHYCKQNRDCVLVCSSESEQALTERCILANPNYAARVKRNKSEPHQPVLERFTPDSRNYFPGFAKSAFDMVRPGLSPHYTIDDDFLADFMLDPTVKILEMLNVSEKGQDFIRITYSQSKDIMPEYKAHVEQRCTIYLDPSHCWCMRRMKRTYSIAFKGHASTDLEEEIEFDIFDHPSGFPLVKTSIAHERRTISYKVHPTRATTAKMRTDYELEVNAKVPDSEFTLSAFGLPEPGLDIDKKPLPIYAWVLLGGVVCILLSLVFRYMARRNRPMPVS